MNRESLKVELEDGEIFLDGKRIGEYGVILKPDEVEEHLPEDKLFIHYIEIGSYYEENISAESPKELIKEKARAEHRQEDE